MLDTGALVPRYLGLAAGHSWVDSLFNPTAGNVVALAEITGVELASALNQMVRGGLIRKRVCERRIGFYWSQVDNGEYHVILITSTLLRGAADLCGAHSLKGYDAVQLAAALAYREGARTYDLDAASAGNPVLGDPIFLTEDHGLAAAAAAEGFTVDNPVNHP